MPHANNTEIQVQHPLRYPLLHCPTCGSEHLEPIVENETVDVHFLCRDCKRCWHVELGHVHGCHRMHATAARTSTNAGRHTEQTTIRSFPNR